MWHLNCHLEIHQVPCKGTIRLGFSLREGPKSFQIADSSVTQTGCVLAKELDNLAVQVGLSCTSVNVAVRSHGFVKRSEEETATPEQPHSH